MTILLMYVDSARRLDPCKIEVGGSLAEDGEWPSAGPVPATNGDMARRQGNFSDRACTGHPVWRPLITRNGQTGPSSVSCAGALSPQGKRGSGNEQDDVGARPNWEASR